MRGDRSNRVEKQAMLLDRCQAPTVQTTRHRPRLRSCARLGSRRIVIAAKGAEVESQRHDAVLIAARPIWKPSRSRVRSPGKWRRCVGERGPASAPA